MEEWQKREGEGEGTPLLPQQRANVGGKGFHCYHNTNLGTKQHEGGGTVVRCDVKAGGNEEREQERANEKRTTTAQAGMRRESKREREKEENHPPNPQSKAVN